MYVLAFAVLFVSINGFGGHGPDGSYGRPGENGASGKSISVIAKDTAQTFNIRGQHGWNGHGGGHGGNAYCPEEDDRFNGGDGGTGGTGGRGGNGGSVTVYFDDIAKVRNLAILGAPGSGGRGAYGGDGGWGCGGGMKGNDGGSGSSGSSGAYGKVTLISQLDPLKPTVSQHSIKMEEMEKGPFELSANLWETRKGTTELFAPGTELSSSYQFFKGRTEVRFSYQWNASKPLAEMKGRKISLYLKEDGTVAFTLPNDLWYEGEHWTEEGVRGFIFNKAALHNEVFQLSFGAGAGSGTDLTMSLKDKEVISNLFQNEVSVEYYTLANGRWIRRFNGHVPAALVTATPEGISVAVGQLTIDPKYLASTTKTFTRFRVTRIMGKRKGTITLTGRYEIP